MFINWSTDSSWGIQTQCQESIPAKRFEVSGLGIYKFAALIAIAAVIIAAIGTSLMITQPVGSKAFWVGTAESLFSISAIIVAAVDYHLTRQKNQARMLHRCTSIEEYKNLLATDKSVNYAFRVLSFISKHEQINQESGADLAVQTSLDASRRSLYCIEGKSIPNDLQDSQFADKARYANQSITSDLVALWTSRYTCQDVTQVCQLYVDPKKIEHITRYNLLSGGDILEVDQLMCIRDIINVLEKPLKYLVGKIRIDFRTGDAVFTWSSPQDERPRF